MDFWIVDVFARDRATTGNPLAVVAYTPGRAPAAEYMQSIAFEFGFSETTFVARAPDAQGRWPVRIFTPQVELPFAGHPTLGSAWVVAERLRSREQPARVDLALGVGTVSVDVSPDAGAWLTGPPVHPRESVPSTELLSAWQVRADDVDPSHPIVSLQAGPVYHVVPVRSLEALARLTPPAHAPDHLYAIARVPGEEGTLRARMFAPSSGVPEDPATGSAALCLGRYLLDTGYAGQGNQIRVQVQQGEAVGRPSLLHVEASRAPGAEDVIRVGGQVRAFASGQLASV